MRKSWFTWTFIAAAITLVFVTFNYQGGNDAVSLSEIFPDEETLSSGVEYEFVQDKPASTDKRKTVSASLVDQTAETIELETVDVVTNKVSAEKEFNYTVQIASFKDQKRAEKALKKIRAQVPSAYISEHDLGEKGIWRRIYAGQFELRSEAEVTLNNIRQSYNTSFIISPKRVK